MPGPAIERERGIVEPSHDLNPVRFAHGRGMEGERLGRSFIGIARDVRSGWAEGKGMEATP